MINSSPRSLSLFTSSLLSHYESITFVKKEWPWKQTGWSDFPSNPAQHFGLSSQCNFFMFHCPPTQCISSLSSTAWNSKDLVPTASSAFGAAGPCLRVSFPIPSPEVSFYWQHSSRLWSHTPADPGVSLTPMTLWLSGPGQQPLAQAGWRPLSCFAEGITEGGQGPL